MTLYTIGFTKKSAEQFFNLIKKNNICLLLDIRLNNKSQLAGFTKGDDLAYFLKQICNCDYKHCLEFAPTQDILNAYKNKKISWLQYESEYTSLIRERADYTQFIEKFASYERIVLLCSETSAAQCHRRLLAEVIYKERPFITIIHL